MNKLFTWMTKVEQVLGAVLIGLLTLLVIADVSAREIFRIGLPWAQKSAVYMMIWAGFLGAALMSAKNDHLRPEVGDKLWKGGLANIMTRLQHLVTAAFTLAMGYFGCQYVLETKEFGDVNVVLDVAMWTLQVVIPYAFFSMGIRHLWYVIIPPVKTERSLH